ncbi:HAD family hydrolase [Methanobrevibacter curvatus]|uniref:Putative copper-importing P-type ATPase A n=1 Tax=Methanobrevibacter curvatus TaxID=49547 RepID=A0A166CBG6_9EURY|nr:HAD family hydrolase [Methanobrevibacter curvatus]KZX12887.1 putative copper-importing P-type ATPase A [Methanobrevibacter curvatus]
MEKKAVIFDVAGTLLNRAGAQKNLKTGEITNTSSLGLIHEIGNSALFVLQTNTENCVMRANKALKFIDFIKEYQVPLYISYSSSDFKPCDYLKSLEKNQITMKEFQDVAISLKRKFGDLEICSGSAFIYNYETEEIEYTIAAGGKIFPKVSYVIQTLNDNGIKTFIASGDSSESVSEIGSIVNIPKKNIFDTVDTKGKEKIVNGLKTRGYKVMMVGNDYNDVLAFKSADVGVLTLEQGNFPNKDLLKTADIVVDKIEDILNIDF